jgi:multiple sugar transport system substrate-binding protein
MTGTATPHLTRRRALALAGASAGAALLGGRAFAQAADLTVFGHRVHQAAATTGPGGDATEAWRKQAGANVSWVSLGDVNAIHERLLREATLPATTFDVAYLLNGRAVPRNLALFEPLDAYQKDAPVEDFADIAPGLVAPLTLNGALHGIPVRHATNVIVYNEALFQERGVALPKTFEETVEAARKLTFKREDGTQVYGLVFTPVFASNFLTIARSLGGDYMTEDRKVVAAEPGMVKALGVLAELYKAGALPRNTATLNNEEITTWIQQGRAAMSIQPFARLPSYNDPQKSKYPGRIKPMTPPMAADLAGKVAYAPTVEFWSLVIPRNARNKKASWDFIRALSSKAATTAMALNGNGPVRISTYADPKFRDTSPFAAEEAKAVAASRIHLPAFDEQARAHDIFVEESQSAMLGMKDPQQAMADAAKRVQPLVGA